MNKRGSIPLFVASTLPIALVAGVFAIDAARIWIAQARLQTALDAAALTAARDIDSPNRDANTRAVLAANFNGGSPGAADSAWDNVSIVPSSDGNSVEVKASVTVDPLLNRIVGLTTDGLFGNKLNPNDPVVKPRVVTRGASAVRASTGIELALVFDITLSMTATDADAGCKRNCRTRAQAVSDAGLQLLEILYGDVEIPAGQPDTNKKWAENLFISVVPFATAVNYGKRNDHILSSPRATDVYGLSWTGSTPEWGGCTEMRAVATRDATPSVSSNGFNRYYAPSTYDTSKTRAGNHCVSAAAYSNGVCMGHNDWRAPASLYNNRENTFIKAMENWGSHVAAGINPWMVGHGPNMMCPPESHSVLPLTRDRATVETRIKALPALPFSAGTNIAPGLAAGWFTLSPNWRKTAAFDGWRWTEPPDPSTDPRPPMPALPFDYFVQGRSKVLILLTDGDNNWMNAKAFQNDTSSTTSANAAVKLVRPESVVVSGKEEGFYGPYGYLGNGVTGLSGQLGVSTLSAGINRLNTESLNWCQAIRARAPKANATDPDGPEQISIHTISFSAGVSNSAKTVLSNCASKDKNGNAQYYHAPDAATLAKIFQKIGAELSSLRLQQ